MATHGGYLPIWNDGTMPLTMPYAAVKGAFYLREIDSEVKNMNEFSILDPFVLFYLWVLRIKGMPPVLSF